MDYICTINKNIDWRNNMFYFKEKDKCILNSERVKKAY